MSQIAPKLIPSKVPKQGYLIPLTLGAIWLTPGALLEAMRGPMGALWETMGPLWGHLATQNMSLYSVAASIYTYPQKGPFTRSNRLPNLTQNQHSIGPRVI